MNGTQRYTMESITNDIDDEGVPPQPLKSFEC